MRKAFVEALIELAEKDDRVRLLTADIGFMVLEPFQEKFPDRFLNVGTAEQSMIGTATGMAAAGLIPWCYTIATFATMRGFEQIRHAAAHDLPIRVVGVGGGFAYGPAGFTHWALEDVAIMRSLPTMRVLTPSCPRIVKQQIHQENPAGPMYMRLGKGGEPDTPEWFNSNSKKLVLAMGTMAEEGEKLAHILNSDFEVVTSVAPLSKYGRLSWVQYEEVITVEEHVRCGGLYSAVMEDMGGIFSHKPAVYSFAVKDYGPGPIGSRKFMLKQNGLTAEQIAEALK